MNPNWLKNTQNNQKTLTGNPLNPAPILVNRFFGGVNNVFLEKYWS